MPIDIDANFKRASNRIANKSVVGTCMGNPIFTACIIVAVVCLILFAYDSEAVCFQIVFYLSVFTISLMMLHHVVVREQMRERYENSNQLEMIRPAPTIGAGYGISPRIQDGKDDPTDKFETSSLVDDDILKEDDLGISQLDRL